MFRDELIKVAHAMADLRILKVNYNAKLQKYFLVAVDRTTKIQKTWAIPASDVWPSQANEEGSTEKSSDSTSGVKEAETVQAEPA